MSGHPGLYAVSDDFDHTGHPVREQAGAGKNDREGSTRQGTGARKHSEASRPGAPRRAALLRDLPVLVYVCVCLLWHIALCIHPTNKAITQSGFQNAGKWLCAAGAVLSIRNLLMPRRTRSGNGILLLYGICASAAVSSVIYIRYGYLNNLISVTWMFVMVSLFYGALFDMDLHLLTRYLKFLYRLVLLIWCAACSLSVVQFCLRIGAKGPHHAASPWLSGVGFTGRRLTGIFAYPEYGAIPGVMLVLAGICFAVLERRRIIRLLYALLLVPILLYIILSVSRSAALALCEAAFCWALITALRRLRSPSPKGIAKAAAFALACTLGVFCFYYGVQTAAKYVPGIFDRLVVWPEDEAEADEEKDADQEGDPEDAVDEAEADKEKGTSRLLTGQAALPFFRDIPATLVSAKKSSSEKSSAEKSSAEKSSSEKSSAEKSSAEKSSAEKKTGNGFGLIFKRRIKKGDITTGRMKIWGNYLSLTPEIGLFGLSPENASHYIQEYHSDLYIAEFIKRRYPKSYENGYVFHTHSGYLRVFVASGFVGAACLLVFMVLCILRAVRCIARSRSLSPAFLFPLLIVITGASSALFDNELFFNQNPVSFLFWISLCVMIRFSKVREAR